MEGSTGDMKNNLMKLLREARRMKLQLEPDVQGLSLGSPSSFLPLLHAALMHYSLPLANWLTKHSYDLYSKSDLRFLQEMYRVLRDVFHYKPKLTKEQFLSTGYAERKVLFTTHVLVLCQAKHSELVGRPKTKRVRPHTSTCGNNKRTDSAIHAAQKQSFVYSRLDSADTQSTDGPCLSEATMEPPHPLFNAPPPTSDHTLFCSTPPRLVSPVRELVLTPSPLKFTVESPVPVVQRHGPPLQIKPTFTPPADTSRGDSGGENVTAPDSWHMLPEQQVTDDEQQQERPENVVQEKIQQDRIQPVVTQAKIQPTCNVAQVKIQQPEVGDVSSRIVELTKVVERMSAKLVLLETQVKLADNQREQPYSEEREERTKTEHHGDEGEGRPVVHQSGGRGTSPLHRDTGQTRSGGIDHSSGVENQSTPFRISSSCLNHCSPNVRPHIYTPPAPRCNGLHATCTPGQLRPPIVFATPSTPEDTRNMIEGLRERARKTREFLQLANSHQDRTT